MKDNHVTAGSKLYDRTERREARYRLHTVVVLYTLIPLLSKRSEAVRICELKKGDLSLYNDESR